MKQRVGSSRGARFSPSVAHERPADRVRQFLLAECDRPDLTAGTRLPPVRQLAGRLNVGVATVHTVLKQLAGEGRVRTQVGNGTFLVAPARRSRPATFRIALNIPMVHPSPAAAWGGRILQEIIRAAARDPRSVMIMPLEQTGLSSEEMTQELMEERSEVDALILFPDPNTLSDRVRDGYENDGKPVVFINPPMANATTNFVSADFFGAGRRLGEVWKDTGRKRVVFLSSRFVDSVSSQLECLGLMMGLDTHGREEIAFEVLPVRSILEDEGHRVLAEFLDQKGSPPDAVFCAGDNLALGALRALREHQLDVPGQVSVVGATGVDLGGTAWPQLTRVAQPFRELSEATISMVCERIEQKGAALPGRVLSTPFMGGATTRAEENKQLGVGQ